MASRWQQRAVGGMSGFNFIVTGVAFVAMLIWGVVLLAQHTVQSVVLGVVVMALGGSAVAMRVYIVRARVRDGLNPITGRSRPDGHT